MLSIFKKKTTVIPTATTSVTEVPEVTSKETVTVTDSHENEIRTKLTFPPSWEIPLQEQYVYQYHHQQLFPLKENQLSISGVELFKDDEVAVVIGFIRNTLPKAIRIERFSVLLLDEKNNLLARKLFNFNLDEEIQSLSSIPYRFVFSKEDWLVDEIPENGWSLAFEVNNGSSPPHQLQLHESWEKVLSDVQKTELAKLVHNLPSLKQDEVNFMGIEVKMHTSQLIVTLLVRNGSKKNISLTQLPLCVEDANGIIIAQGVFGLDNFEVKANTSKPWTFIFPESLIQTLSPDLSKWKVYPPK
jgi:accessory Sec system S-layer assembly protein